MTLCKKTALIVSASGLRRVPRAHDAEVDGEAGPVRCGSGSRHRLVHVRWAEKKEELLKTHLFNARRRDMARFITSAAAAAAVMSFLATSLSWVVWL